MKRRNVLELARTCLDPHGAASLGETEGSKTGSRTFLKAPNNGTIIFFKAHSVKMNNFSRRAPTSSHGAAVSGRASGWETTAPGHLHGRVPKPQTDPAASKRALAGG